MDRQWCHAHSCKVPCLHCLRTTVREKGMASMCCALCRRTNHTARYCPLTKVGRRRVQKAGLVGVTARTAEPAE